MPQDQPTQAMASGKQCGTRETSQPQPTHPCPSAGLQGSWGAPGRHSPKGCGQEGAGKDSLAQAAPTVLPHIPARPVLTPYLQIVLAPRPDPPTPYTAPNCGQVSLQERWHHPSTYFSKRILPLFQDGEEEAPYTLHLPPASPRDTGKHQ